MSEGHLTETTSLTYICTYVDKKKVDRIAWMVFDKIARMVFARIARMFLLGLLGWF
jgi:hypothetical protein